MYGQFLFVALYLGYSIGVAPVFSFNYGSRNKQRLIRLYRISIRFVVVSSVIIALVAAFGSPVISAVFMRIRRRRAGERRCAGRPMPAPHAQRLHFPAK